MRLTAPSITSLTGITLAGSTVDADGNFKRGTNERYTVTKDYLEVKIPAESAAMVIVH